ncbi:MAG: DUF935 family protein [Nitrospiraceae bacterium]|nr:DUF935 family protein [Nitrospiraceae bacterium]
MALLDQFGKEIRSNRPITDEIAGAEKDIFRDYIGNIQLNPDRVLRSEGAGKGIELYEDLLRDAKVGATLQTRRLAITGKEWQVDPASDKRQDVKIADYVSQVMKAINLDAYRRAALSGIVLGYKPCEIMWDYSEGDVFISKIIPRASRRFTFGLDWKIRLLTLNDMIEGEVVPDRKFQVFVNPSDNGSPYGDGLGRMLYWPVWFKKNVIKFWMIFADKFGSPTAVGKYPVGTTKEQQTALLNALEAIQQESAIKIPDTLQVEFLEAQRTGSIDTYDKLCQFMDRQIAMIMLGHTGSSESEAGKLGNDQEARDIRQDYIRSDADLLCESENNQLVRWICDYNFPSITRNGYPKVWIKAAPGEDLKALAERDKTIVVDIGLPVSEQYFYDTYGIPQPQEGEAVVKPAPKAAGPAAGLQDMPQAAAGFSDHVCSCGKHHEFAAGDPSAEWVSKYMDALAPELSGAQESALKGIEAWLKSLDAPPPVEEFTSHIHGILGDAYSGINTSAIADTVAEIYMGHVVADALGIAKSAFGGADLRAIDFLSRMDSMYVSKWIQNPDAVATVKDFLTAQYHEGGANIFGRTDPESIQQFRDLFGQKLSDLSDMQVQRIVDTSVQRTRNWATTSQLHKAGITEIQVIEPTNECDFCKAMNGRVISVGNAFSKMQEQMQMTPDEYAADLKDNVPTVGNVQDFVDSGLLPPYHPHCHGKVVKRVR